MFIEPDGVLGPAEQPGEPSLALDQRQVAQVVAVMLDQVEGVQHCLTAPTSAPQRMEVRRPVVAGDHGLAVDQERRRLDAEGRVNDSQEAVGPLIAVAGEAADARAIPAHHQPIASCCGVWGMSTARDEPANSIYVAPCFLSFFTRCF
jgi:hypothetical protein